jgi:murein L,D-transpeptidase YcbB/YkuD
MRVDKPFELLDILLQNAKKPYSKEEIEKILASNKPTTIRLRKSIPVHILYFTVYKEDGLAYFKNDIYSFDKIIEESVPYNRKSTFTLPKSKMISVDKNAQ